MNGQHLNPNHPVAQMAEGQWHKLCALAMVSMGTDHVVIDRSTVQAMQHGLNIVVDNQPDGVHLRLVDDATAQRLARAEGGLPQ